MVFSEPLELPVYPDRRWCAALVLLALAVCGTVGYWAARAAVAGGRVAALLVLAALALACAWREMSAAASGTLAARGGRWFWRAGRSAAEVPMRVRVVLDAGAWLLLELRPAARPARGARRRWIALARGAGAPGRERWRRLRCLLQQPARAPQPETGA